MILKPYSLKKFEKSIATLSPKGIKKPSYIRIKNNRDKNSKGALSLCSIETNRQSSSLTNRKMLSHRKLISMSSLQHKHNLTQRKCPNETGRQRKSTIDGEKKQQKQERKRPKLQAYFNNDNRKFHINKFTRNDRLHTIQNNEQTDNLQKVLEIKQNILKQFIDRFQQELKEISQKKSSRKTLLTNRLKSENSKQETTKKPRNIISNLQSNSSTVNLSHCTKDKQNIPLGTTQNIEKNTFKEYINQIKDHKKKDQKIFIMKNHKKSLQNISISKIGQTYNFTKICKGQMNKKINLKELFRHSKKYEPFLKDSSSTMCLNSNNIIDEIAEKESKFQKSSLIASPIKDKQKNEAKQSSGYMDCSSIQKMNQSSFISQIGRKSLLKHLNTESVKIMMKEEQRKTKKCLAKMKNIFPSDFF